MNKWVCAVGALAAALVLSGCSVAAPSVDSGKKPSTEPEVTASPEAVETAEDVESEFGETVTSIRGNMVKQVGQLAGTSISGDPSTIGSRFVVTDIVLEPTCDSGWADEPSNGHYLALHFNVETTPELAQSDYPEVWFSADDFQAYDLDGKRLNDPVGNAWSCMSEASTLPQSIGPGQSASGFIVLDVADEHGAVVLLNGGGPTGWEWEY